MNKMTICCRKIHLKQLKTLLNENIIKNFPPSAPYTTIAVDNLDTFTNNLVKKFKNSKQFNRGDIGKLKVDTHVNKFENLASMRTEELNNLISEMMINSKDAQLEELITQCRHIRKLLDEETILKLFQRYSAMGRPDMIILLKKYCEQLHRKFHDSNNEFLHFFAKAECLRGNSEKGLSMLAIAYGKNQESRCYYRILFRELIQDSVFNRSEASLVIFRKYVQKFSEVWNDHYPLVCLWYLCWSSTWYSDQMLSNDLLESSEPLLNIVRDKAVTFSIHVLKMDYKDDAVVRLLQTLLKYDMMCEYSKVLQVLFNHKLRTGDLQGCAEIVRNAEVLGIKLPSSQQGRYINLLIGGTKTASKTEIGPKDFKLKF